MSHGSMLGILASSTALTPPPGSGYVTKTTQVAITIPSGSTSATATIPACNTALSFLVWDGLTASAAGINSARRARIELTNATTITATRGAAAAIDVTVYATLVECSASLVASVQQGTVSQSATVGTATIAAVDITRSVCIWLGSSTTNAANNSNVGSSGVDLTNSTTVTCTYATTPTTAVNGFVVVEFQPAAIVSVQKFAVSTTGSTATTVSQAISSVTPANSLIFYGGISGAPTAHADTAVGLLLTSSTNVDIVRYGTVTSARVAYFTVIDFSPLVMRAPVQRGLIAMIGVASNTAALTALGSKSVAVYAGNNTAYTSTDPSIINVAIYLNSTTSLTGIRAVSNALANDVYYQVADFN